MIKMSNYDIYKYYCITEGKYIKEKVYIDNIKPTICKNNPSHQIDTNSMTIFRRAIRKSEIGLSDVTNIKDNISNSIPSTQNDTSDGYSIGSKWIDTVNNNEYVCIDANNNSAIWKRNTDNITGINIGSGSSIYSKKSGDTLEFKTINSMNGINISDNLNNIDINLVINTLSRDLTPDVSNDFLLMYKSSTDAHMKVLIEDIFSISGEANTGLNIGSSGVGIYKSNNGSVLEFKKVNVGSNKLLIIDDTGNNEIDIDIVESNVNHDNLFGYNVNKHIDHSLITLTTGEGLSGGGDLTASRTLSLDINSLSNDLNPDSAADYVVTYDMSNSSHKKVLINNLISSSASRKCDIYHDPSTIVEVTNSWIDCPLNIVRIIDSNFTHNINSSNVMINTTDNYLIIARCSTYISNGSSRSQSQVGLFLDAGSGYNIIDGSFGYIYNKEVNEGYGTSTIPLIMQLNAGNEIKMSAIKISGSATINYVPEACSITIHNI